MAESLVKRTSRTRILFIICILLHQRFFGINVKIVTCGGSVTILGGRRFKIFHMKIQTKTVGNLLQTQGLRPLLISDGKEIDLCSVSEQKWKYEIQGSGNMKYYFSPHLDFILNKKKYLRASNLEEDESFEALLIL